jgi:hypothetical protein
MLKQAWTSSQGPNPLKMVNLNPKLHMYMVKMAKKSYDQKTWWNCSLNPNMAFKGLKMVQIDPKID